MGQTFPAVDIDINCTSLSLNFDIFFLVATWLYRYVLTLTFAEKHLLKPHTSTFVTVLVQKNGAARTKLWKMQECNDYDRCYMYHVYIYI